MANNRIIDLPAYTTPDRTQDVLPIDDIVNTTTKKITVNNLLGITGAPVGTTDSQSISNKTIGNTNTATLKATSLTLQDQTDTTKQAQFALSGITTGTTRTYTLPNASSTLVDTSTAQTLTNKTLTSPVINSATIANPTLTVDSISGYSSASVVAIAGMTINTGVITTANAIQNAAIKTGELYTSKVFNPYKFSAYLGSAQNSINGTTKVSLNTKAFDTSGNFDNVTNYRFTAPIAGFYHFTALVTSGATPVGSWQAVIYKNGSASIYGTIAGAIAFEGSAATNTISLAQNDYIELFVIASNVYAIATSLNFTYLSGFLVSAT